MRDERTDSVHGPADRLVDTIDELSSRIGRMEMQVERLAAQLQFAEVALASCIERERVLLSAQDTLRDAVRHRVRGLTTE